MKNERKKSMEPISREQLKKERENLEKAIRYVKKKLRNVPDGTLRVQMNKKKIPQYYLQTEETRVEHPKGVYIPKANISLVKQIAQKEYDEKYLENLEKRYSAISRAEKAYSSSIEFLYDRLPKARKLVVTPITLPKEEFIKAWRASMRTGGNSYPILQNFFTENGEQVRSKTEQMIADKFNKKEIPYVYEPALKLGDRIVYPDFGVLNLRTRETIYYEHFGMMDEPEYCKKALAKIENYERNGFCFSRNLLYSFETKDYAPDMRVIDLMISTYCQ